MSATLFTPLPRPAVLELSGAASESLRFELCADDGVLQAEYRELDTLLGAPWMACSALWTETWRTHYGDLVRRRIATARNPAGELVAACLLTARRTWTGPIPIQTWHVGTSGEPDADSACVEYNRVLAPAELRGPFLAGLQQLASDHAEWDQLLFPGAAPDDAADWDACAHPGERRESPSHWFDLQAARAHAGGVLGLLGSNLRSQFRRDLRSCGDVQCDWAETPGQAAEIFDDLVRLHQARWIAEGQPGSFASRRFTAFHRDLIARGLPAGRVVLFRARTASRLIGCLYLLVEQNRLLFYQSGFEAYAGNFRPGIVTHVLCQQAALERGYDAYDFLAGDAPYKRRLSTDCHTLTWSAVRRPRLRLALLDGLRSLKRRGLETWRTLRSRSTPTPPSASASTPGDPS